MRPILFAEDETNFNHNGIGVLDEALTSEVTEVTNGEFEVIIDYPVSGRWFKEIKNMMIVRVKPNAKDDDHNFRIYDIDKTTSTKTITIYAHSITNDIGGNLVKSVKVDNKTAQEALNLLKNSLVEKTDITFQSDITTKSSTEWTMQNPLNAIVGSEGSMVQYWGGEIKRTDRILYLMSRRGTDRVTTIRPQKGMTGLTMKTSTKGIITRILPYFVLRDEEKDTEQTIVGTIVASPLAGNYPIDNLVPVDYGQDDEIKTLAQLNAAAKTYFTTQNPGCDKPDVEINVDLLQLADTPFYSKFKNMEAIGLTDTIIVYVPKYDVDVEVKVNELVYNSLAEKTTSITAGDISGTFYESSKKDYDKTISALQQYVTKSQNGLRNYVQISANGKNKVYRGYTEPDISLAIEGDLWFKEIGNGEQEIWIFDGAYWQPLMTAGINVETQAALDLAQQALDKAKEDLKAVEDAMVDVDAAMKDLETEMATTAQAATDAKTAAADAQIAADDASAVGKAAQEAGDQALSLVDQAQKDIDSANATIGAHTIDLSKLFSDFASMDTVVDAIVIDTGTMKTAISENDAAIKSVKATTDQAIADNAADILTAQQLAESAKSKADAVEATTHTITEDLDGITETITTIEQTATSTTKTLNEVKSTVDGQVQTIATVKSTADSALSKSNTNSTTIDGIQTTLTSTKTTADSALSKANLAKSTADGNTTMISSVSSTATSALSKANTAQSTADGNTAKITSVTTTANSALSKANTLEETVDGVTRTLTSVQEWQDDYKSGGRNYFKKSEDARTPSREFLNTPDWDMAPLIDLYGVDEYYTVSFDLKSAVAGPINVYAQNGSSTRYSMIGTKTIWATTEFVRYSYTFKTRIQNEDETRAMIAFYGEYNSGRIPTVRRIMFEVGTVANDWSPNPDELATVTKVNTISDTVDGHTQLIASTKSTADSALTKANSAQSTADGNTTKITTAQTTATNALTKANTVEQTVDGQKTTITSIQKDLSKISQGSRNLLMNSSMSENTTGWSISADLNGVVKDGYLLLNKTVATTSRSTLSYNAGNELIKDIEPDTEYSLGFAYYVESVTQALDSNNVFLRTQYGTTAYYDNPIYNFDFSETGVWKWAVANGSTQPGSLSLATFTLALGQKAIVRLRVKNFVLVKGKNVKDWSPNISDLATTTKVNQISDTVDGHTQLIASTKTTADSALTKANSAQSTADGNTSKITATTTTANTALSTANTAKSTADGNSTKITSVTTTANSALTKANSAQSTADGNTTKITAVTTTANSALAKATSVETTANGLTVKVGTMETNLSNTEVRARLAQGMALSSDPEFRVGNNGVLVYNNSTDQTLVTVVRETVSGGTQPTGSPYRLKITVTGTANPSYGGVVLPTNARVNAKFVVRFVANIPSSRAFYHASNSLGTGGKITWITSRQGTGTWEEYMYLVECGTGGTFGNFGHIYVQQTGPVPTPTAPLVWYLASYDVIDITRTSQSQLQVLSDEIDARVVSKKGVINAINVSTEGVVIAGNKITITGTTTIASSVIKTAHIADANISTAKIADLAVANGKIANLAVTEGKIGALAVTNAKIGALAVDSAKLANASVIEAKIGSAAVTTAKIGDLAVTTAKIGNLAVTDAKIANATITAASIQDAAIISAKIANLAVTGAKIADATISSAKIISLDAGKISARSLSAIVTNTGSLNVSGWLNITNSSGGIAGTFDYTESEGYRPRKFSGEWALSNQTHFFNGWVYEPDGTYKCYAESYFGLDYFKFRQYTQQSKATLMGRVDITGEMIELRDTFNDANDNNGIRLYSSGDAYFNGTTRVYGHLMAGTIDADTKRTQMTINYNRDIGRMLFSKDSTGRFILSDTIYNRTYNSQSAVCITDAGTLGRIVSARKYKTDIKVADIIFNKAHKVLEIQPQSWFLKEEVEHATNTQRHYGFIADDFDDKGLQEVVIYDSEGEVDGLSYDRITMYHNVILKKQQEEINELKNLVNQLLGGTTNE